MTEEDESPRTSSTFFPVPADYLQGRSHANWTNDSVFFSSPTPFSGYPPSEVCIETAANRLGLAKQDP